MKLLTLYEGVIKEGQANHCVANFGKVLFGDQLGGGEKNTGGEQDHAEAVYNFTDYDFGENINDVVQDAILNLRDCMRVYPEILVPENELVYRGTSAPIMTFINEGLIPAEAPQPYMYKARSPIQSWSDNIKTAQIFGDGEDLNTLANDLGVEEIKNIRLNELIPMLKRVTVPVILEYRANSKEFLFKGKYLNKLSEHPDESEVLRISIDRLPTLAHLNSKWVNRNARVLIERINDQL